MLIAAVNDLATASCTEELPRAARIVPVAVGMFKLLLGPADAAGSQ
jgi:hypothetical protein